MDALVRFAGYLHPIVEDSEFLQVFYLFFHFKNILRLYNKKTYSNLFGVQSTFCFLFFFRINTSFRIDWVLCNFILIFWRSLAITERDYWLISVFIFFAFYNTLCVPSIFSRHSKIYSLFCIFFSGYFPVNYLIFFVFNENLPTRNFNLYFLCIKLSEELMIF